MGSSPSSPMENGVRECLVLHLIRIQDNLVGSNPTAPTQ